MSIRFVMAGALSCLALSLNAAMIPGEEAPDLSVRDSSGATVKLSAFREKKQIALLSGANDQSAANWVATARLLAPLDTVVLFRDGPAATVLIDRAGVVRRVLTGRALAGGDLQKFVETWRDGKLAFIAYCARCHGEYGDEIWCDPKPLTGVGQRLSLEQIMEILHPLEKNDEVMIRAEWMKKVDLENLLVYLRGL